MIQRHLPTLLALLLLLSLACGGSGSSPDGDEGSPAPERRFLSLGTAPPGGAFFAVGSTLAEVASQTVEGWEVTPEATKGSRENIRRLAQGELDFALSNAAITYYALRGEAGWDKAYGLSTVMTLAPNVAIFISKKGSGVETIADLRGKRVVIGPAGAGFEMFVTPILAAHGLSYDDMTVLNGTQAAAVDMLADGSADAAYLGGAVPTSSITQAATSMDIHYVPFDAAAREQLIAQYPFFSPATIPADTYKGLTADMDALVVGAMHLITAEDQDPDVVETVTRALYEGRDRVAVGHPAGKSIRPGNVERNTGTPFHPGAIRFYRELGIWPEEAETTEADSETAGGAGSGA